MYLFRESKGQIHVLWLADVYKRGSDATLPSAKKSWVASFSRFSLATKWRTYLRLCLSAFLTNRGDTRLQLVDKKIFPEVTVQATQREFEGDNGHVHLPFIALDSRPDIICPFLFFVHIFCSFWNFFCSPFFLSKRLSQSAGRQGLKGQRAKGQKFWWQNYYESVSALQHLLVLLV